MGMRCDEACAKLAEETGRLALVLKVGYRGEGFSGYAEQEGQRTVAGELRRTLETLLRREVELTCAGRTDAGVSALSQYVSLDIDADELYGRQTARLWRSLAAITPEDVSIRGLYAAREGFSARFDALSRSYRYRIAFGNAQPVLAYGHCWWLRSDIDVDAMADAVRPLVGEHDFRSFCKKSSADKLLADGRSCSRNLTRAEVTRIREAGEDLVAIDVEGNAFLHNMVRIIVGTLVEVGRGRRPVSWPAEVLDACDRHAAGPTAPACGLVFEDVRYEEGSLVPLT